jgi:hypothetical protein
MCPECDRRSDARSTVCVHCGFNFETKTKAKRVYEPIHREWQSGWPIQRRLALFMGMQFINLLLLVVSLFSGYSICAAIVPILMTVGLQAFLTGTFDKLILTRDSKGKVRVTRICSYAFFARPPITVRWKSHETVSIVQSNEFSVIDWAFVIILLGYGILPGVLFYWFVLRPDKFTVYLCKDHGFPETAIFRTQNEELSKEIQTTVSEVTLLPIQK